MFSSDSPYLLIPAFVLLLLGLFLVVWFLNRPDPEELRELAEKRALLRMLDEILMVRVLDDLLGAPPRNFGEELSQQLRERAEFSRIEALDRIAVIREGFQGGRS